MKKENGDDRKEAEEFVKYHVKTDQIEVPEFPMRHSRASPAANPFEPVVDRGGVVVLVPMITGAVCMLLQAGLFLLIMN
ncbi:hypothetical protein JSY36_10540 [Bacillus sp. H-16]|uniref:hypothetical protein n=1 Tax=Alteribacter salitolerans TaxID=2912333 RepID=UPI001965D991|nr:hypothetical protein [Alteribacter salitolerans]MBM7096196.1 hypothetical protein [Alteribacter salitolerans]